jgi:cytochrome c-type biogenesis protein CcmH
MTLFFGLLLAMLVLAMGMVLFPLLRQGRSNEIPLPNSQANLSILREQLAQLDAELSAGTLTPDQHKQGRVEIEQRVLEELPAAHSPARAGRATGPAIGLALCLPLLVVGLYGLLGNPQAAAPEAQKPGGAGFSQAQIEAMVEQLAAKLEGPTAEQPPDPKAWEMLARSYAALSRFAQADKAYARAIELAPSNAQLLADRADVLAMLQGQSAAGEPTRLVERALLLDPNNLKALAIAGTAALERSDPAAAIAYWNRAKQIAPPGSEFSAGLESSLEVARSRLKDPASAASTPAAPGAAAITGTVSLSPALAQKVEPGDTVFIFARAANGPRMPIAALRHRAGELPLKFTLDDRSALSPQMSLSSVGPLVVGARVSRSGNAMPQAGDLLGQSGPVQVGAGNLKIVIDQVQP